MSENGNTIYGDIEKKILPLQVKILGKFLECAMYQKFQLKWKEEILKKAKSKRSNNKYGGNYRKIVENTAGFLKCGIDSLDTTPIANLIRFDFGKACCEYKNINLKKLLDFVKSIQDDRNNFNHEAGTNDAFLYCINALAHIEQFLFFLEQNGWQYEASEEFIEYLYNNDRLTYTGSSFLEDTKKEVEDYKGELISLQAFFSNKAVIVEFVDDEDNKIEGVSYNIILKSHPEIIDRNIENNKEVLKLQIGEYIIKCNSVPDGYEKFATESLTVNASANDSIYKKIILHEKYNNKYIEEINIENECSIIVDIADSEVDREQSEVAERLFEKGCEHYYKSEERYKYSKAFNFFKQATEHGHIEANMYLAKMYFEGNGVSRDVSKACVYFKKVAEYGNKEAQYYLGSIFEEGSEGETGVEQNYAQALFWYQKAAEQNHVDAMFKLGKLYLSEKIEGQDKEKGFNLIGASAKQGNAEAQYFLGKAYEIGLSLKRNYIQALFWYKRAEKRNNTEAICSLGKMYFYGKGIDKDEKKAFNYFQKAAEKGDGEAQYFLGLIYQNGYEGFDINLKEALLWYQKAAEQNNVNALVKLGDMYYLDDGVGKDYAEALKFYKKAADQGDVDALNKLGIMYRRAEGVDKDEKEAVKLFEEAAAQGNVDAMVNLGLMYDCAKGVEEDKKKAVELYEQAVAQGNVMAINILGEMYEDGDGVNSDEKEAAKLYEQAAVQGYVRAMVNLGCMYDKGRVVDGDRKKAVEWYIKAVEQGDIRAMKRLTQMYYHGDGVDKNYEKVFEYINRLREDYQDEKVLLDLGVAFFYGKYLVKQNYENAVQCFLKAEEHGSIEALNNLVYMYEYGKGVKADKKKAFELCQKAADKGNVKAIVNLGVMYSRGEGVKPDKNKAIELYERAAKQGNVQALNNLGIIYERDKDTEKAIELYKKAIAQGSEQAERRLQKLQEKISDKAIKNVSSSDLVNVK